MQAASIHRCRWPTAAATHCVCLRGWPFASAAGSTANASAPQLGACAAPSCCRCSRATGVGSARDGTAPGPMAAECDGARCSIGRQQGQGRRERGGKDRRLEADTPLLADQPS